MARLQLKLAFVALAASAALALPAGAKVLTFKIIKAGHSSLKEVLAKDAVRLGRSAATYGSAAIGSGTVTNELDSYVAPVIIGSQTFSLIVDTGSSSIWVGADKKFIPGTTGKSTGESVSVSYGSGSFVGTEYTDSVTFAGLTVKSQSIGVAPSAFGFMNVDGIFGLGPADLTQGTVSGTSTVPTFMDNLYSQGTISTEVLGVYFAPIPGSGSSAANGELTLGGTDSSRYSGSITYTPTLSSASNEAGYYWGITVTSLSYAGTSVSGSSAAIVDTGTTLVYIPTSAYIKFLSASGGTTDQNTGLAAWTTAPTGTFNFTIGGTSLPLMPSQYLVPTAEYSEWGLSTGKYYSYISDGGSSGVDCIIGQKFLENYYSVFDTTNKRVGFATRT